VFSQAAEMNERFQFDFPLPVAKTKRAFERIASLNRSSLNLYRSLWFALFKAIRALVRK
jgi:hypothetical protein